MAKLLNILGGIDTPTSGTAFWRDHELAKAVDAALTRYRRDPCWVLLFGSTI